MHAPENPRCIAYVDMQWMLRTSKFMFDNQLPNFNPKKFAEHVCAQNGYVLEATKAYIDVPSQEENPWWSSLWRMRVEDLDSAGVKTWFTPQRLRQAQCIVTDAPPTRVYVRSDMEVSIKMSVDIMRDVCTEKAQVVLLISKENKYIELVESLKVFAREEDKYVKIISAYPYAAERGKNGHAGINRTDWFPITAELYEQCTDFIRKPPYHSRQQKNLQSQQDSEVESVENDASTLSSEVATEVA